MRAVIGRLVNHGLVVDFVDAKKTDGGISNGSVVAHSDATVVRRNYLMVDGIKVEK